jgi:hypothetical protein
LKMKPSKAGSLSREERCTELLFQFVFSCEMDCIDLADWGNLDYT